MNNSELYYGDNLDVLRNKLEKDSIDLCYIDPPFNSKRNYFQIYTNVGKEDQAQAQAFIDTWTWNALADRALMEIIGNEGGRYTRQTIELIKGLDAVLGRSGLLSYLVSMTQRVNEIQRVLKPTGSFYLHCDPTASHYLKLILDSVFCARGGDYLNEIVWPRTNAHNMKTRGYVRSNDIILFYTKSQDFVWNKLHNIYSPAQLKRYKPDENGRLFTGQDLTLSGNTSRNFIWRGTRPAKNRGWAFSEKQLERLWEEGKILTKLDGRPRLDGLKVYLDERPGKPIDSNWVEIERIGNTSRERLGYPTQKPEALLERIIQASSNKGDVILDAYCGCGTTVAVAQRLKRQWIGIDITYQSIAVVLKRLEDQFGAALLNTITLNGIPRDMESAIALANKKDDRVRKEFEKWAILTYSKNHAIINEKKGADRGIDGIVYIATDSNCTAPVVFQVKSGKVGRGDIAKLNSDRIREKAVMGIFITLQKPTADMKKEALDAGFYHHVLFHRDDPVIRIVTVQDMIEKRELIDLPLLHSVLKTAAKSNTEEQFNISLDETEPDE
ncbi:DNA methyltransferase [Chromatium okenii]|jgi:site-specific DNA-methyltransferase (adenine-specific)|uniref:Site-specific DNA-methyltransferase n=2 Tax=Chromatium okenii TaxID=61644 RepID=A0A2S7XSM5_9GAMM|nr:DNA methyltransferase [Chromatium okenii]PQJ96412.1 site-specific DNA-methyltransferase [Chromatium okenii]